MRFDNSCIELCSQSKSVYTCHRYSQIIQVIVVCLFFYNQYDFLWQMRFAHLPSCNGPSLIVVASLRANSQENCIDAPEFYWMYLSW